MTDRGVWVAVSCIGLNVRRLMYQSLIWALVLGDDPSRLRASLDPENCERLTDPLVHRVRRNVKLGGDFLGRQESVNEAQAIKLGGSQSCDALGHRVGSAQVWVLTMRASCAVRFVQCNTHPAKHAAHSEQRVHVAT